ncbi:MAG: tetratricopeptide repeat protein [Spirochaetaceae bacterium]|jgi:tetratricopeptide (TPR) repeat protein|nr:tetratricopeptide repeat protein [Spirochaetaceae bacterium]
MMGKKLEERTGGPRRKTALLFTLAFFVLGACSSAPERPAELFTLQNETETQLNLANREADRGNYEGALTLLEEARRLAASTDRPPLLIRVWLSQGNVLFSLGRVEAARALWDAALAESERAGEEELAAASRIYMARSSLILDGGAGTPEKVIAAVREDLARLKSDKLNSALGWTVIGIAEKELRHWAEAESALAKALDIHEKDRYLELAAYDWYLIASVRSVSGRYDSALEALSRALALDRRAENSYGLGMDWLALGEVYQKAARGDEALAAYRRSAEIFRAIGLEKEAAEAERRTLN